MSQRDDYAKQYWQLGNVITGFAVAQAVASIFSYTSSDTFACNIYNSRLISCLGTVLFHSIYGAGAIYCYLAETRLLASREQELSREQRHTLVGRLVAIGLFGFLFIGTIVAPVSEVMRTTCGTRIDHPTN